MIPDVTGTFFIRFFPLLAALALAAAIDAKQRRIPNWLTFSLLLAGILRAGLTGGAAGLAVSGEGIAVGAAVPLALFAIGALGGGDVKLMGAIGAWLGPGPAFAVYLTQAVIGLGIVLIQALMQGRTRALFRNTVVIAAGFACVPELGLGQAVQNGKQCRSIDRPLPYAVPVFVATVIVLALSRLVGR